jgi:hypothetical protein
VVLSLPLGVLSPVGAAGIGHSLRALGAPEYLKYVGIVGFLASALTVCVVNVVRCERRGLRGRWFAFAGAIACLFWLWLLLTPATSRP